MPSMLIHPQFDPVALALGPLKVHWYGLTYLAAFLMFLGLARLRLRHSPWAERVAKGQWSVQKIDDLLFFGVLGVVLGGRLGYCLFYMPAHYLSHPVEILYVWQGVMSFHGGMLGVIAAMAWLARREQMHWLEVTDFVAPCVPTGLAAGRVGNFINGECFRKVAARRPAIRPRSISFCLKAFCFLPSCGGWPGSPAQWVGCPRLFFWGTVSFVSLPSTFASPMPFWVCWRRASAWDSGCAFPCCWLALA